MTMFSEPVTHLTLDLEAEVLRMCGWMREVATQEVLSRFGRLGLDGTVDFDISTEADKRASLELIARCGARFPGSYSEEHLLPERFDAPAGFIWQFDPVDGTIDFANCVQDGFAMHAALLHKRDDGCFIPVAGIVYLPGVDRLWYGWDGVQPVCQEAGQVKKFPAQSRAGLRCYLWRFFDNQKLREACSSIAAALPGQPQLEMHICGAMGSGVSSLLSGEIDLLIANQNSSKEWDVAMALPLVRARGGFICDCDGREFKSYCRAEPFNSRGVVMSITCRKEEILPHIPAGIVTPIVFSACR